MLVSQLSALCCLLVSASAIGDAQNLVAYFTDYTPYYKKSKPVNGVLPYALGQCQPGPQFGTFARYSCDPDGAGVYRRLYNDPRCRNSWSNKEYGTRELFNVFRPPTAHPGASSMLGDWTCKGADNFVTLEFFCDTSMPVTAKIATFSPLVVEMFGSPTLRHYWMKCGRDCSAEVSASTCHASDEDCGHIHSFPYSACLPFINRDNAAPIHARVVNCVADGALSCGVPDATSRPSRRQLADGDLNTTMPNTTFPAVFTTTAVPVITTVAPNDGLPNYVIDLLPGSLGHGVPYAMDKCNAGSEPDTWATFTCDFDGAGVWKTVFADPGCSIVANCSGSCGYLSRELLVANDSDSGGDLFAFHCGGTDEFMAVSLFCDEGVNDDSTVFIAPNVCGVTSRVRSFSMQCTDECDMETSYFRDTLCTVPIGPRARPVVHDVSLSATQCKPWYITCDGDLVWGQVKRCRVPSDGTVCGRRAPPPRPPSSPYFIDKLAGNSGFLVPYAVGPCHPSMYPGLFMKFDCDPFGAGMWKELFVDPRCRSRWYPANHTNGTGNGTAWRRPFHFKNWTNLTTVHLPFNDVKSRELFSNEHELENGLHGFSCSGGGKHWTELTVGCGAPRTIDVVLSNKVCVHTDLFGVGDFSFWLRRSDNCSADMVVFEGDYCGDDDYIVLDERLSEQCRAWGGLQVQANTCPGLHLQTPGGANTLSWWRKVWHLLAKLASVVWQTISNA